MRVSRQSITSRKFGHWGEMVDRNAVGAQVHGGQTSVVESQAHD